MGCLKHFLVSSLILAVAIDKVANKSTTESQHECTTVNDEAGKCVLYFHCNSTYEAVRYPEDIDLKQSHGCPGTAEVCCKLAEVTRTDSSPRISSNMKCGYSNPGGADLLRSMGNVGDNTTTSFGEFPWMVAVIKRTVSLKSWSEDDYICGGALIHPGAVLTGAHKINNFKSNELKCRAGLWDTQTDEQIQAHQDRNVKHFVVHKDYNRESIYNSIAIIFLESRFDVIGMPHITAACIGKQLPPVGTICHTTGWGKRTHFKNEDTSVLKKVSGPLLDRSECEKKLRKTRLGEYFELHSSLTCAGGDNVKSNCKGYGGSPLVCTIDNATTRYAVFGVVAYGINCGRNDEPGVYVHVTQFSSWIDDQMTIAGLTTDTYKY